MKTALHSLAVSLLAAAVTATPAAANLVLDGTFTGLTYSQAASKPLNTLYGQFGNNGAGNTTLSFANWSTTGYNFVYANGTADAGTTAGANSYAPNAEAPGLYNTGAGYGSTYLYGAHNGGTTAITSPYAAGVTGNFIAADGAFQVGAITQTINNLTPGRVYFLSFSWAAAQQQGFAGATTENWQVHMGNQTYSTSTFSLPNAGFSGWMQQSFAFVSSTPSTTLSFLASGTPTGQPPFSLLANVDLEAAPEPSTWAMFVGGGAVLTALGVARRRRLAARAA